MHANVLWDGAIVTVDGDPEWLDRSRMHDYNRSRLVPITYRSSFDYQAKYNYLYNCLFMIYKSSNESPANKLGKI